MQEATIWRRVLGLGEDTIVEEVEYDAERDAVVASVRPRARKATRKRPYVLACGLCAAPSPKYDDGEGRREWRGLDVGECKLFLEGNAPRVSCSEHGVTVAKVPWARHKARHTRAVGQPRHHTGQGAPVHAQVKPPGEEVTVYPVTGRHPSETGAVHDTDTWPLPGTATPTTVPGAEGG